MRIKIIIVGRTGRQSEMALDFAYDAFLEERLRMGGARTPDRSLPRPRKPAKALHPAPTRRRKHQTHQERIRWIGSRFDYGKLAESVD